MIIMPSLLISPIYKNYYILATLTCRSNTNRSVRCRTSIFPYPKGWTLTNRLIFFRFSPTVRPSQSSIGSCLIFITRRLEISHSWRRPQRITNNSLRILKSQSRWFKLLRWIESSLKMMNSPPPLSPKSQEPKTSEITIRTSAATSPKK